MLLDCSPTCVTAPDATFSTSSGSMPARSITAVYAAPSSSLGCVSRNQPFVRCPRPIGVRAASTMTTSRPCRPDRVADISYLLLRLAKPHVRARRLDDGAAENQCLDESTAEAAIR